MAPYRLQFHSGVNDEAVVIQTARRLLEGQVPYRDFDLLYTPGSMIVTALWMSIGGQSITCARWLMLLLGALAITLIYLLSRETLKGRWALLPASMFALSGYSEWPILSYHWFAALGLLACLYQWLRWYRTAQKKHLFLAGIACGCAALCLQSEGVASFLAASWLSALGTQSAKEKFRHWLVFLTGVLAVWLPFLGLLVSTGALWTFIDHTIYQVLSGLLHSHAAPYNLAKHVLAPWNGIFSQWPQTFGGPQLLWLWESLTTVLVWTLKYAFLFPVMLLAAWHFRRDLTARATLVFLLCWTLMLRERLDLLYTNYLMPLWYVALVLLLVELEHKKVKLAKIAGASLFALYLSAGVVALKYCESFRFPVVTQAGILWANDLYEAEAFTQLYRTAAILTPPGTKTFAWPYAVGFYVLSGTHNASRSDFLVPGWQGSEQVRKASASLQDVDTIYFFPLDPNVLADYPNIDPSTFESQIQEMSSLITAGFQSQGQVGPATIYRRTKSDATHLQK